LYGREPRTPVDVLIGKDEGIFDYEQYGFKLTNQLLEAYRKLRKIKRNEKSKAKAYFDKQRQEAEYVYGDKVLIFWPRRSLGPGAKLTAEWLDPWKVVRKAGPVDYWVRWENGNEERVHVTRMKPYIEGKSCTAASTELIQNQPDSQQLPDMESEENLTTQENWEKEEKAQKQQEADEKIFDSIEWKVRDIIRSRIKNGEKQFLISWKTTDMETIPNEARLVERLDRTTRIRTNGGATQVYRLFWKQTWETEDRVKEMAKEMWEKWTKKGKRKKK
jgi:hypothetical protein